MCSRFPAAPEKVLGRPYGRPVPLRCFLTVRYLVNPLRFSASQLRQGRYLPACHVTSESQVLISRDAKLSEGLHQAGCRLSTQGQVVTLSCSRGLRLLLRWRLRLPLLTLLSLGAATGSIPIIVIRNRSEEHTLNSSHVAISYCVFCL